MSLETAEFETEAVAVIGMAGRFPKAPTLAAFWENLENGKECIRFFSSEELEAEGISAQVSQSPEFVPARAILDEATAFDAQFFGINPREAEQTDPQHRLFLEIAWEALESAGCDPSQFKGLIGVYAGADVNSYAVTNLLLASEGLQTLIGNDKDYLATRVAYKLNLRGPAISVQTACSTSLVAVHLACQSLLSYQSDLAIAGGVGVGFPQKGGYFFQEGGILSPDGHCRPFDAAAKGTVGGDGVGAVVLKRLSEALSDGDEILAVIKGSAVNNDGAQKVGFTAPSVEGQAEVIAMALAAADVPAESITYIETHGTGTQLGDPIEVSALQEVFGASTDKRGFCALGSLKSNVGHMNSAAGIGSLIKAILALRNEKIPPSLHYHAPNPMIDFASSCFYVAAEPRPWAKSEQPRRAGVSSFGIGGTNAHLILEEAPAKKREAANRDWQLLPLSAKSHGALLAMETRLADWLESHPEAELADVAFSLQQGRQGFAHARNILAKDKEQAIQALRDGKAELLTRDNKERKLVFLFSGQGSQYAGMTRGIYESEPVYREHLDHCLALIQPLLEADLAQMLFPEPGLETQAQELLCETRHAQPALFAVSYALAKWWISLGLQPSALFGHSIGEYVAACLAEVMSLEDAITLVVGRGADLQAQPPGAMLSVPLGEEDALKLTRLSLCALNGPTSSVVGGTLEAVAVAERLLREQGISYARLHTSHAFHTPSIAGMAESFLPRFQSVSLNPPTIPFISNVSGSWIKDPEATDPGYWVKQCLNPVRFSAGLATLAATGELALLEVGPGNALIQLAGKKDSLPAEALLVASSRHPRDARPDMAVLLEAVGALHVARQSFLWKAFHGALARQHLQLPCYPFERELYWSDPGLRLRQVFEAKPFYGKFEDPSLWLYAPEWRRLANQAPMEKEKQPTPLLVFAKNDGPSAELLRRLRLRYEDVVAVQPGPAYRKIDALNYQFDPFDFGAYDRLISELTGSGMAPRRICHLWQWYERSLPVEGEEAFERSQAEGFYSLLFLTKALGKAHLPESLILNAVASGIFEITGSEKIQPERATSIGVALAVSQEYSRIIARVLDLEALDSNPRNDRLFEKIIDQMIAPVEQPTLAFRGSHCWIPDYQRVRCQSSASEANPAAPAQRDESETGASFHPGGVYLITGGLGGIGLIFARYLAKKFSAKLVLTGRTGVPARSEWDGWLNSHDPQNRVSVRIRKLIELEEMGADVLTLSADAGNQSQMEEVWRQAKARFGRVNGLIHAAGHVGQGLLSPIAEVSWDQCQLHFHSKIHGLYTLMRSAPADLDFCLLTSSLASVLGGVGGAAYAAANAFMDAYAQSHANQRTRFLVLNWDAWMPHEGTPEASGPIPAWARFAIKPDEGVRVLEHAMAQADSNRFVVSTTDLQLRLEQLLRSDRKSNEKALEIEVANRHSRPAQNTEYLAPRNELETLLAEIWQALLGIDKVGVRDNFFKLGGDSLVAIQLGTRLRDALGIEFSVNQLFDEPTIAGLAERIEALRGNSSAANDELLLAHLDMIEQLSEEEAAKMLAELEEKGGAA